MIEFLLFMEFLKNLLSPSNVLINTYPSSTEEALIKESELSKTVSLKIDENFISAKSVLIKEIKGGTLYSKNIDEKLPIASLTKLMTALVSLIEYNKDTIFEVPSSFNFYEPQVDFKKGEKFKRDDLIKAMLVSSSNASAILLSSNLREKNFVDEMNKIAKFLGLRNTEFEDVTGISPKNVSTIKDIYYLSEYIISEYPEIFYYSRSPSFVLKGNFERILYNTNKLIYKYGENILGSKTGFTDEAKQCLIMIVKFKNSPLVFVGILGSEDRVKDGEYILKILESYYNK